MTDPIAVRLLGPIEATGPLGPVVLNGARQRSVLALLALRAGQAVGSDRLIDGLWGDDAPRTALRTLQSHLARIRQALHVAGWPDAVASSPAGHVLRLPAPAVDAHAFTALAEHGRQHLADGAFEEAAALLGQALSMWRGEPLQDGEIHGQAAIELDRLADAKALAVEDLCDTRLRLGDHAGGIAELAALLAAEPYRERCAGLLMLALYRAGRAGEALTVYQKLRTDLADGLGVDPSGESQQLFAAILRQDPALDATLPGQTRPAELPPRVGYFTGREAEIDALNRPDDRVALIIGAAGMGKTALAVEWAHAAARRFPDGQLFLDLQGHDPDTSLSTAAILGHLLRGLGVPADRVPAEVSEQTSLYRSLVSRRRYLIMLDNAATADQVGVAVPATRTSRLVITTRHELAALAIRHPVHFIQLAALDPGSGLELLRQAVDPQRIQAELPEAQELVRFCDGMPLAVRITAARLATRPALTVAELVADLRLRELDALAVPGDSAGIRSVFASAYRGLDPAARRLFRLLATHPGPSLSAHLAAAAAGVDLATARDLLTQLTGSSLLNASGERYAFHDLIRRYAAECARVEESDVEVAGRILHWYLGMAQQANRVLDPGRDRVKLAADDVTVPFGQNHQDVLAYLDGEQSSLGPVVRMAAASGDLAAAWQLTYLVAGFYDSRGSHDRIDLCAVAVRAAQDLADPEAQVLMHNLYAATCVMMQRYADALAQLDLARPLAQQLADTWLLAMTYTNIAVANTWLRRYDTAQAAFETSLQIHTGNQNSNAIALSLNNLGDLLRRAGRGEQALTHLTEALQLASTLDSPRLEAIIRHSLGEAARSLGDLTGAIGQLGEALTLRRRIGDRRGEANALQAIGVVHLERGDTAPAIEAFQQALELSRLLGNEHLEAMLLNRLGEALLDAGDSAAALATLEQSERMRTQMPDPPEEELLRRNLIRAQERAASR